MLDTAIESARAAESGVSDMVLENDILQFGDCSRLDFERMRFTKCRFTDCNFTGAGFYDTVFENCLFSGCRFENSYFRDSTFSFCKGDGSIFRQSVFRGLKAENSSFCYGDFAEAMWDGCIVRDCEMRDAFMSECKLKKAEFHDVNFTHTDFFGTMLKGQDLSDCIIDGIMVSEHFSELKGLKVNSMQAADLACMLGIKIV